MENKKYWLAVLCLLILATAVLADTNCPTKEEYRDMVKEATNDYFTNPNHDKLIELQDMLKVYATHDFTKCLEIEEEEEEEMPEVAYTCSDGTAYDECSVDKPLYCEGGELVELCSVCGCNLGYGCQEDGSCAILSCSDRTLYDRCSVSKPLFCENGNLVNKCSVCGCYENQVCQENDGCINKTEVKDAILLIMEAEKLLAEKALETAKNTPIKYPKKYEKIVKKEIQRAEQWLNKANQKADQGKYEKAVDDYKKSWEHSQEAIKFANKEKPKEHPVITVIKKIVEIMVTIIKAVVNLFKKLFRW